MLESLTGKLGKFRPARNILSACLRLSSERQGFALCQIFIFIFNPLLMSFLLGFLAAYCRKLIFLIVVSNQREKIKKKPLITSESFLLSFIPAVAFALDIQPPQQVLRWRSIKSLSCQSPAVSITQCFQNLHLASIHMTLLVGLSYHWVARQLYMKGHKVNENSIKTRLAFSEITKTCSQLNISFIILFFF